MKYKSSNFDGCDYEKCFPNITGETSVLTWSVGFSNAAFYHTPGQSNGLFTAGSDFGSTNLGINANRVNQSYGKSSTVQVSSLRMGIIVRT